MARYRFWIHDKDEKGKPLDEQLVKAAQEAAPTLTRYREEEINCDSTTNRILQSAVEAATRAQRSGPIENPIAYLTFTYKRLVDKLLNREKKVVPVDDSFLEDLANSNPNASFENAIHNRLLLEKLLNAMDPETRQICNWRLQGFSMNEIAKELHISPNSLTVRYTRGKEKAVNMVLQGKLIANDTAKQEAI